VSGPSTHDGRRHAILAIDTATTRIVVATGSPAGVVDGITTWSAGYRHGETLLATIGRFLGEQNIRRSRLTGIVVGIGPGAFTGLRVGIATAKGLAHGLGLPIAGVSTAEALLSSADSDDPGDPVLLLPAGPSDRILVRRGARPELLPGGTEPALTRNERLVAVDLDGRAPPDAVDRGERARLGLGTSLVRLGAAQLKTARTDDLATLVPEYVTLPRGVMRQDGEVAWSRDPR
jgi:tRNA threonylcarbamoyl adenosine modification protein YeaZ